MLTHIPEHGRFQEQLDHQQKKSLSELRKIKRAADRHLNKQENEHAKALSTAKRLNRELSAALQRERERYVQLLVKKATIYPFMYLSNLACMRPSILAYMHQSQPTQKHTH